MSLVISSYILVLTDSILTRKPVPLVFSRKISPSKTRVDSLHFLVQYSDRPSSIKIRLTPTMETVKEVESYLFGAMTLVKNRKGRPEIQ